MKGMAVTWSLFCKRTYRKEATMGVQEATTLKSISRTSEERETINLKGNGVGSKYMVWFEG